MALADNSDVSFWEEITIKGQIIKVTASKYFVKTPNGVECCFARGVIKYKGEKLIVGDNVEISNGVISSVYPRKSKFLRPNVANVDYVNIVVACVPKPDYFLIDKSIATAVYSGAKVYLTVNKCDITQEVYDYIVDNYESAVDKIYSVSAQTGIGLDKLKSDLSKELGVFMGQSAVGKTSLINSLFGCDMRVGDVSDKTQRGRHTTTSSQIFSAQGLNIVDTPGFSSITCNIPSNELRNCYKDFLPFVTYCYYLDCEHINEPDCGVKEAIEMGKISKDRYERYKEILKNLKEEEKNAKY